MRALIVDDSRTDGYLLASIAATLFTEVVVVGTPADMTKTLKSFVPDIIFMDVFIGSNHNGINIIDDLRQLSDDTSIIPMVITSSAATSKTVAFALENGATDFLSKPVTLKGVIEIIDKHLIGYPGRPAAKGEIITSMF